MNLSIFTKIIILLNLTFSTIPISLFSQENLIESTVILPDTVLKPGNHLIEIPFNELLGSVKIDCDVSEQGELSIYSLTPKQIINYIPDSENIVQFFVSDDETPLLFSVDSLLKVDTNYTVYMTATDTMSLIRHVVLENNQLIYATHNNIDPNDVFPDEDLANWHTIISEIDYGNDEEISLAIEFINNDEFDLDYLIPFNQITLSDDILRGAVIGAKIKPSLNCKFGKYYYNLRELRVVDTTFGPHFDLKLEINNKDNSRYDSMMWCLSWTENFDKVYPLEMIFELPPAWTPFYKHDNHRTVVPGFPNTLPHNLYAHCIDGRVACPNLTNLTGDTIQFRTIYGNLGRFFIRPGSTSDIGDQTLYFYVDEMLGEFKIRGNELVRYMIVNNGSGNEFQILDTIQSIGDFYGFDISIHNADSLTFIPSNAIHMSKPIFYATNTYETAEPWRYFDTIAPTVVSTIPVENDSNVSVSSDIRVKFDEEIIAGLINENNFVVVRGTIQDSVEVVEGSFSYIDATAIFSPDDLLKYSSVYEVYISNLTDLAGNVLPEYVFSFTTEPDTTIGVKEHIPLIKDFDVIPNPAKNQIYLSFELLEPSTINLKIIDIRGKSWEVLNKELSSEKHRIPISIEYLPQGIYFIKEESIGLSQIFIKE